MESDSTPIIVRGRILRIQPVISWPYKPVFSAVEYSPYFIDCTWPYHELHVTDMYNVGANVAVFYVYVGRCNYTACGLYTYRNISVYRSVQCCILPTAVYGHVDILLCNQSYTWLLSLVVQMS